MKKKLNIFKANKVLYTYERSNKLVFIKPNHFYVIFQAIGVLDPANIKVFLSEAGEFNSETFDSRILMVNQNEFNKFGFDCSIFPGGKLLLVEFSEEEKLIKFISLWFEKLSLLKSTDFEELFNEENYLPFLSQSMFSGSCVGVLAYKTIFSISEFLSVISFVKDTNSVEKYSLIISAFNSLETFLFNNLL